MSKFWQFQCEACGEMTTATQNSTYSMVGNKTYQKINPIEIERGCQHVCIDDEIKFLLNPLVIR